MQKLEEVFIALTRRSRLRGTRRLLQFAFPCDPKTKRHFSGVYPRTDGQKMKLDSRNWIDRNVLFHGDLEVHLTRLWERLIRPGDVVIDVGANIGVHTLTFAKLVAPGGRVLAFEPNPRVRETLETNLQLNAIRSVEVFDCGLGNAPGHLPLRVPKKDSPEYSNMGLASFAALETPHDLVQVPVRTLDEVLEHVTPGVALVKIDVQGFEHFVLQGMVRTMRRSRPKVVFEYEQWAWQKAEVSLEGAYQLLEQEGYRIERVTDDGRSVATSFDEIRGFSHVDLLAIPRGQD